MQTTSLPQSAHHLRTNHPDQAHHLMQQLSTENPHSIEPLLNLSTISMEQGNIEEGLAWLRKARELEPFDFRVYYNMFGIYWRSRQYYAACESFRKCLSVLYVLRICGKRSEDKGSYDDQVVDIDRAIELWPENTAAYAIKAIKLINLQKLEQANEVTKTALQTCILKHHIYAICCLIDSKLNQQAQREQSAKNYHSHLLRPISTPDSEDQYLSITTSTNLRKHEQIKLEVSKLIEEFNRVSAGVGIGRYCRYSGREGVYFVTMGGRAAVNVEFEISRGLGIIDLACIEEENQNDGNEDVQKQLEQDSNVIKKKKKNVTYKQGLIDQGIRNQLLADLIQNQHTDQKSKDKSNQLPVQQQNSIIIDKSTDTKDKNINIINQYNPSEKDSKLPVQDVKNKSMNNDNQQSLIQTKSNKSKGPVNVYNWSDIGLKSQQNLQKGELVSQKSLKLEQKQNLQVAQPQASNTVQQQDQKVKQISPELKNSQQQKNSSQIQTPNQNKQTNVDSTKNPKSINKSTESKPSVNKPQQTEIKPKSKQQQKLKNSKELQQYLKKSGTNSNMSGSTKIKVESQLNKSKQQVQAKQQQKVETKKQPQLQKRQQSDHIKSQRQNHPTIAQQPLYPITHRQFQIKLLIADLQINQQLFGKMDPYVYYEYGNQKHKSTIAKGQGTKPRWQNEIQRFSLEKVPTNLRVSVYDREMFKWDDLVGSADLEIVRTGMYVLEIQLKGKKSGEVMFVVSKCK